MSLLRELQTLITEHGSAAVLRERLGLFSDKVEALEQKLVELQKENAALKEELGQAKNQLKAKAAMEEFVEHWGALFKRKIAGGYHEAVFCPDCRGPMFSFMGDMPFHCSPCKRSMNFTGNQLAEVMRGLPRQE